MWNGLESYGADLFGPTSWISDKWFHVYSVVIAWITVASTGLGSELVFGVALTTYLFHRKHGPVIWHFAQFMFSLMLMVAFVGDSGFGLPFLTFGLWKFGFPETISTLLRFRHLREIDAIVDGIGLLLHHLSTSLTLVGIMLHLFPRDRAMTAVCVVPMMQHWFVLVKYRHLITYIAIELLLEVYFQWEVISNLGEFNTDFGIAITRVGRGCALTMLFAHWLYLIGAIIRLFRKKPEKGGGYCSGEQLKVIAVATHCTDRFAETSEGLVYRCSSSSGNAVTQCSIFAAAESLENFGDKSQATICSTETAPKFLTTEETIGRSEMSTIQSVTASECRSQHGWCGEGPSYCNAESLWSPACAEQQNGGRRLAITLV